jgi:hypothetical protein
MTYIKKLILTALFMLAIPAALFAADTIAYVGEVGGEVTVTRANPGEVVDAQLGMLLNQGDMIRTENNSHAAVIFQDDGSRVKLGENSQLTLNAQRSKKKLTKRLFLNVGKLWAKVTGGRGTDFQVATPTSVASVKGTRFVAEYVMDDGNHGDGKADQVKDDGNHGDGSAESWFWALDDPLVITSGGNQVTITGGQYAKVSGEGIESGDYGDGDVPVEPGRHKLIIYLDYEEESSPLQKELHIDFEY